MITKNYYPETNEGRADWWANIRDNGAAALAALGFTETRIASILNDAAWAIYTYGDLQRACERYEKEVAEYISAVTAGANGKQGQPPPLPPSPPKMLPPPEAPITCDIEQRRLEWVQEAKDSASYSTDIGEALGLIPFPSGFDPWRFRTELLGLMCTGPKTVRGKFRKVYGNLDGIILRGRRRGAAGWTELGRFTATPFTALVPVDGSEPQEEWEFQAAALKRDLEVGRPSEIVTSAVEA